MIDHEVKGKILELLARVPIIEVACKKTGIHRSTFYRWREDQRFRDEVEQALGLGRDVINDIAESKEIEGVNNGEPRFVEFWLKHNHPRYMPYYKNYSRGNLTLNEISPIRLDELRFYPPGEFPEDKRYCYTVVFADFALSEKEMDKYSSILSVKVYLDIPSKELYFYVLPNTVMQKTRFADMSQIVESMYKIRDDKNRRLLISDSACSYKIAEHFEDRSYIYTFETRKLDSPRGQLEILAPLIKDGLILFPRGGGAKNLITQLLGYDTETYAELVHDLLSVISWVQRDIIEAYKDKPWPPSFDFSDSS